jgi:hypothetical protein
MEGTGGQAGIGLGGPVPGEAGVDADGELGRGGVVDAPERADDVLVAGQVEAPVRWTASSARFWRTKRVSQADR